MDIELIDPRRVRIALDGGDMKMLNMTYRELMFGANSLGPALLKLLETARAQTGFACGEADKKLFVEIYPDSAEGCVIYFTRLQRKPSASRYRIVKDSLASYLFRFQDADALVSGCRAVFASMSHRVLHSSLYYAGGTFYLALCPLDAPRCAPVWMLREFGDLVGKGGLFQAALAEHGQVLLEQNAIDILAASNGAGSQSAAAARRPDTAAP